MRPSLSLSRTWTGNWVKRPLWCRGILELTPRNLWLPTDDRTAHRARAPPSLPAFPPVLTVLGRFSHKQDHCRTQDSCPLLPLSQHISHRRSGTAISFRCDNDLSSVLHVMTKPSLSSCAHHGDGDRDPQGRRSASQPACTSSCRGNRGQHINNAQFWQNTAPPSILANFFTAAGSSRATCPSPNPRPDCDLPVYQSRNPRWALLPPPPLGPVGAMSTPGTGRLSEGPERDFGPLRQHGAAPDDAPSDPGRVLRGGLHG